MGLESLTGTIQSLCTNILDHHAKQTPLAYEIISEHVSEMAATNFVTDTDAVLSFIEAKKNKAICNKEGLAARALTYLHNTGEIVLFNNRVCLRPHELPKIMAKFISPTDVREKLMKETGAIEILDEKSIRVMLHDSSLGSGKAQRDIISQELEMMVLLGVCYLLRGENESNPSYLFPSLGTPQGTGTHHTHTHTV